MNKIPDVKISIITVCRNSVNTIEQTLCSVVNQSYKNVEYIVIDGGSDDGTLDIIRKYEARISYWISEPDRGIYDAMNKGIEKASGDVVAFLNSDDWYETETLNYVARQFTNPNIQVLSGRMYYWIGDRREIICRHDYDFHLTMACSHPATFVRKYLFERYGKFDIKYAISGDHEWLLRIYNEGIPYTYCKEIFTNMRHGGASCKNEFLSRYESQLVSLSAALDLKAKHKINEDEYCDMVHRINIFRSNLICGYTGNIVINEKKIVCGGELKNYMMHMFPKESYALFGSGGAAKRCIDFMNQMEKKVSCIYDNDSCKWGKVCEGIRILSPGEIKKGEYEIIVTSERYEEEITEQLERKGLVKNLDFMCFSYIVRLIGAKAYGYI